MKATQHSRGGEDGSVVVEFVFLGLLLLIPLTYLVLMFARLQAGTYAVTHAARESGRVFIAASSPSAEGAARAAAELAFEDQGFGGQGTLTISCASLPCLQPQNRITTTARVHVPLPFIPAVARDVIPLEVPVSAEHVTVTDQYRRY
ncbi:pilus assembly protein TadE [Kribbia dieselivorans]|uniref:pilus assembly protein TadE n=1 Tax=Kribbia dieselivorans TaxID=331526 RepID=UPI000839187A|nr:pilus assembly protein TadE [Kribbia dieselivorans]